MTIKTRLHKLEIALRPVEPCQPITFFRLPTEDCEERREMERQIQARDRAGLHTIVYEVVGGSSAS